MPKTWTWDDPTIMRIIAGTHVNSWEKLLEIARYQAEKGATELVIREAPPVHAAGRRGNADKLQPDRYSLSQLLVRTDFSFYPADGHR